MTTRDETILLIDDETQFREMMALFLKTQGFRVLTAGDGRQGLEAFRRESPDVTIVDLKMPVMTGVEFLQAALTERGQATIMVLTAFATMQNAIEAMKLGAYDYLTKPIEDLHNDLLKKIDLALERNRLVAENDKLNGKLRELNRILAKRQQDMDAELAMGGVVQQSLLPAGEEQWDGIRYGVRRLVAEHVSGDFYDVTHLGEGRFAVLIGQVFGRDVPGALLMSMIITTIRDLQRHVSDPLIILNRANAVIKRYLEKGYQNFVTAFYGVIDLPRYKIKYVSASHPAPTLVHYRNDGAVSRLLTGRGNYLGKYADAELSIEEIDIRRGDLLFLHTESVWTAQSTGGEAFGNKRLFTLLERLPEAEPTQVLDHTLDILKRFEINQLRGLDLAMMAIRIGGLAAPSPLRKPG